MEQVISDAEAWATEQKWFVHRDGKTITEEPIGSYEVPALLIQAPAGRFVLEPRGRCITGATGAIELSVFPSYESVLIVRNDAGWHLVVDRPTLGRSWSKEAFLGDPVHIGEEGMIARRRRLNRMRAIMREYRIAKVAAQDLRARLRGPIRAV